MRRMLDRISPVLIVSVVLGGFVLVSSLPATAEQPSDRLDHLHAERPVAALHHDPLARLDPAAFLAGRFAGLAAPAPPPLPPPPPAPPVPDPSPVQPPSAPAPSGPAAAVVAAPPTGGCTDDVSCFLQCTRAHESDSSGGYSAVSPGGTYRGAYQFDQATWDAAVAGSGNAEYAGMPADQAPPAVQDAAAAHLYEVAGNRPWGGRC